MGKYQDTKLKNAFVSWHHDPLAAFTNLRAERHSRRTTHLSTTTTSCSPALKSHIAPLSMRFTSVIHLLATEKSSRQTAVQVPKSKFSRDLNHVSIGNSSISQAPRSRSTINGSLKQRVVAQRGSAHGTGGNGGGGARPSYHLCPCSRVLARSPPCSVLHAGQVPSQLNTTKKTEVGVGAMFDWGKIVDGVIVIDFNALGSRGGLSRFQRCLLGLHAYPHSHQNTLLPPHIHTQPPSIFPSPPRKDDAPHPPHRPHLPRFRSRQNIHLL